MKILKIFTLIIFLAVLGAGCAWFGSNGNIGPIAAGPRPADLEDVSPEEASKRINFVVGSQIEMVQSTVVENHDSDNKEGVRIITIDRFAPMYYANLNWKLSLDAETQDSIQARRQYDQDLEEDNLGDNPAPAPEIVTERQTVVGTVDQLDLNKSHNLFLPAYWPPDEVEANGNSGIWLSDEVYEEIKRTGDSTIYFGMADSSLFGLMGQSTEFANAIKDLQKDLSAISGKIDPDLTTVTTEVADWPLYVNGKEVTVRVIKASNWFGDMVILDNKQNPLILKMTFNPQATSALESSGNKVLLESLLSYEVTRLSGVQ
ncbi:hypothetical protein KKG46_00480 [Patescibacteria group bacterium]|nr:hypothetical protein [Patescibacteria group bacterium]